MGITIKSLMLNNYLREVMVALRQGIIYCSAYVPTVGPEINTWGPSIIVEPVFTTTPSVKNLAVVIQDALQMALSYKEAVPINARDAVSPWLVKANVKTEREFTKGESSCTLYFFSDKIEIQHWKPEKKGYNFDSDGETTLSSDCTFEEVAKVVLDSLQNPSRMHPL